MTLRLVADREETRTWFTVWLDALKDGADEDDWGWYMPEERLWFRRLQPDAEILITEFSTVASGTSAIVQINEPRLPGREDGLSAVARDADGLHYLVRQGELRRNARGPDVKDEFGARTGLSAVAMTRGDDPANRAWFVVTPLEAVNAELIRARTADFVDRCWTARTWGEQADADQKRLATFLGKEEHGGESWITPDPAPRKMRRTQGYVWRSLYDALDACGIAMTKPRHARGYEVDAVVDAPARPLLIEIKTSIDAAAVYTGLGQLTIYPVLLPDLAEHERVLLLPAEPQPPLAAALASLQITVHTFVLEGKGRKTRATFDQTFLARCGAGADQSSA